jgi:hypothetical protein
MYQLRAGDGWMLVRASDVLALDLVSGIEIDERSLRRRLERLAHSSVAQAIHAMLDQEEPGVIITVQPWKRQEYRPLAGRKCMDDQIRLDFPDCPFCANHLEHCNLLFGVVEACVRWLYDTPDMPFPVEVSQKYLLHIQPVQADSHSTSCIW